MSMEEWPDDHLDNLFRKSAEEYDVPFNADDWADMSRRLDKHDRHSLFDRISRWGGVAALLLLLLMSLVWVTYDAKLAGKPNQLARLVTTPAPDNTVRIARVNNAAAPPGGNPSVQPTSEEAPKERAPVNGNVREQPSTSTNNPAGQLTTKTAESKPVYEVSGRLNQSVEGARSKGTRSNITVREKPSLAGSQRTGTQPTTVLVTGRTPGKSGLQTAGRIPAASRAVDQVVEGRTVARVDQRPAQLSSTSGSNPSEKAAVDQSALPVEAVQPVNAELGVVEQGQWLPALTPLLSLSSISQPELSVTKLTPPEPTGDAPQVQAVPKPSRLSVMLFASPDLSSIGLKNFDRPGSNAGLAIQYQLTDRLSINTGAMYSTKRYQTYNSDYEWPPYFAMEVTPEEITGVCKMIDVPVNVRYDWLLRPRGDGRAPARWFVSAGMTSYFIKHEVYTYGFANPKDPKIKYWGWDNEKAGRPGGSFGFSNLNISVGYERPITRHLSWQVEPFMKVPLKQVGYFKIRLLSTGAFIGLRYRL